MKPVLVQSCGRSGSTLTMRLLGSHPEIAAHLDYPCELRLMSFVALRGSGIVRDAAVLRYRFDGDGPLLRRPLRQGVEFGAGDVRRIYARIARGAGKRPHCFAEKALSGSDIGPVREQFPDLGLIVLVRDPRDVLLSARALNARRGYKAFFEKDAGTDEESLAGLKRRIEALVENSKKTGTFVLRYEDLVREPAATLRPLLEWLDVRASKDTIAAMIVAAAAFESAHHRTSATPQDSIGRWRREMSPELQALFTERLGPLLDRFGYA